MADFNQYGTRRGNHEVMMRGTFANIRIKNQMVRDEAGNVVEGGYTIHQPSGERMFIYDAAMRYQTEGVPLVVLAGKEYGTGSSRDWAAKGTNLLGVRAVIAESFERIHRSNLVGMGVAPFVFEGDTSWASLGLKGDETVTIHGLAERPEAAPAHGDGDHLRGRRGEEGAARLPHRYARRAGIFPQRRHSPIRAAAARGVSFPARRRKARLSRMRGGLFRKAPTSIQVMKKSPFEIALSFFDRVAIWTCAASPFPSRS